MENFNDFNKNYNKIAKQFSQTRENLKWSEIDYFLSFLDPNKKYRILDLGCANARLYQYLKKYLQNFEYIGIDQSEEFINIAEKQYPELKFYKIDFSKDEINFLGKFDVIFSLAVFHHFDKKDFVNLAKKINVLLKNQNSYLFLTVWNLFNLKNKKNIWRFWKDRLFLSKIKFLQKYNFAKNKLNSIWTNLTIWKAGGKTILYYFVFRKYYLRNIFKKAGFIIEKLSYFNGNIFTAKNIILVAKKNKD